MHDPAFQLPPDSLNGVARLLFPFMAFEPDICVEFYYVLPPLSMGSLRFINDSGDRGDVKKSLVYVLDVG